MIIQTPEFFINCKSKRYLQHYKKDRGRDRMIFLLLLMLAEAEGEAIDIFNRLDNDKKLVILRYFKQIFIDEINEEIALFKDLYKKYEGKRTEIYILHEFGVSQGYVSQATSFTNDIDYQLDRNFENVNDVENMDLGF